MDISKSMRTEHRRILLEKAKTSKYPDKEIDKVNAMKKKEIEQSIQKIPRGKIADKAKKDAIAIGMLRKLSKEQLKSEISIMKKALTQGPMDDETEDMPGIPGVN